MNLELVPRDALEKMVADLAGVKKDVLVILDERDRNAAEAKDLAQRLNTCEAAIRKALRYIPSQYFYARSILQKALAEEEK